MKSPKWKQFEIAVASFISALDANAKVTHDAMIPDKDTGTPRQRDVWIETTVFEHFPLKILVSCKRYKKKLNQQHIDAFIGELQSSGAQKGIIYSFSGFTKPAIEKGRARGISCCRLYQNETPDLPESLIFDAYLLTPGMRFAVGRLEDVQGQPKTIGDLLDVKLTNSSSNMETTLLDLMEEEYHEQRNRIRMNSKKSGEMPSDWMDNYTISDPKTGKELFEVEFGGRWIVYEARLEGYFLNGSYNFTNNEFKGKQKFPEIDKSGPNPGAGWKQIDSMPKSVDRGFLIGIIYGSAPNLREEFRKWGDMKIEDV